MASRKLPFSGAAVRRREGVSQMSDEAETNKGEHKAEEMRGKLKEGVGGAVGDDRLEKQGQTDQASSRAKQAGDDLKDAAGKMKDRLTDDDKDDDHK